MGIEPTYATWEAADLECQLWVTSVIRYVKSVAYRDSHGSSPAR